MMPTRLSLFTRGTTWLLALAFFCASLPAPVLAQDMPPVPSEAEPVEPAEPETAAVDEEPAAPEIEVLSPGAAARERIRQLRAGAGGAEAPAANMIRARTPAGEEAEAVGELYNLNLKEAQLDVLLDRYSELTGRTMIKAPGISATFTFKAQEKLTRAEMLQAMPSRV